MPEAETFNSALRPILVMKFVAGLGCVASRSKLWFKFIGIAYSTGYLLGICLLFYYASGYIINQRFRSAMYVNQSTIAGCYYPNVALNIMLILVSRFKSKKLQSVIEMIEVCDRKMQRMGLPNCYRSLRRFQWYNITVCVTFITLSVAYMFFFEFLVPVPAILKIVLVVVWNLPWMVVEVSDISFYIFIRHVTVRFQQLNDLLRGMLNTSPASPRRTRLPEVSSSEPKESRGLEDEGHNGNGSAVEMRALKETHMELTKIARAVNDVYGMQILLTTAISFVFVTSLLYVCYKIMGHGLPPGEFLAEVAPLAGWILFFALKFCALSYTCAIATCTAADAGDFICELYKPWTTKNFRLEIRDFTLQLIQNPLVFKACGFFTVDHGFLQTVARTITTYLVILIQVGETPKLSPPRNTTATPSTT